MTDQDYMRRAIELAKKGEGWCHPNPMVGAVIVKEGRIIGEGWHERCGELHAERNAFASLKESAEGATIYVTLEPCCHYGKQPPCVLAIIENKIARVVIGSRDPNPLVSGKGAAWLRSEGILVEEDFLREECDRLNPVFFHYITKKTPYVIMKYAMTADGKIATKTGASKWITGEASRQKVQELRHACMGIMAGIGTVIADDPMLNCRMKNGRSPIRIICDSSLRIPMDSRIVKTAKEYETIVVCAAKFLPEGEIGPETSDVNETETRKTEFSAKSADEKDMLRKCAMLNEAGLKVLNIPKKNGRGVDLKALMPVLGGKNIDSILLEGGGTMNESALEADIVSEIRTFVAPKIFGGEAKTPVEGAGVEEPAQAKVMKLVNVEKIGEDLMITYRT